MRRAATTLHRVGLPHYGRPSQASSALMRHNRSSNLSAVCFMSSIVNKRTGSPYDFHPSMAKLRDCVIPSSPSIDAFSPPYVSSSTIPSTLQSSLAVRATLSPQRLVTNFPPVIHHPHKQLLYTRARPVGMLPSEQSPLHIARWNLIPLPRRFPSGDLTCRETIMEDTFAYTPLTDEQKVICQLHC
jgi:hypothetical protein